MFSQTRRAHSLRTPANGNLSFQVFLTHILTLQSIWRERRALNALNQEQLKDIGQSRHSAENEARRPAWDAPNRWLL